MSDKKQKGYRNTLNLPQTAFAMKANLVQREPQQRKAWEKQGIYDKILAARAEAPLYVLHDGPPYANGDIHMGHVINKVLKDFVIKYRTMRGFKAPYIPGWDCHGLPIEVKVMAELGEKIREMSKPEIRKECQKYASKYVKLQAKQFRSLGIFGDFDNPYLTMKPSTNRGSSRSLPSSSATASSTSSSSPFTGRSAAKRPWPMRSSNTRTSPRRACMSTSRWTRPPRPGSARWAWPTATTRCAL